MKKVYFVRHAESEANVAQVVSGAEHDSPLTKNGHEQAKRAGQDLKYKGVQLIVCSPMARTVDTATIIAKEIGYDPKAIIKCELFIERYFGELSGKSREEYAKAKQSQSWPPSVESSEQLHKRISEALKWLKSLKEKRIVVLSHGATGRMVRVINQELHHSDMDTVDKFANTEIYEFTL
jgi:broad specificity phosphatase PhoE